MHNARQIVLTGMYEDETFWDKIFVFIPGSDEQFVMKEVLIDECYAFDFNKDDVVLNLGGHIGAFDVYAFDRVKEIITFEPDINNFVKLEAHIYMNEIKNVKAISKAIAPTNGLVGLLIGDQTGHNTCVNDGNGVQMVECSSFVDVLTKYKPTKIKCDIEGFEYDVFDGVKIPEQVNEIWFETHTFSADQKKRHTKLCKSLEKQKFEVTVIKNDPLDRTFLVRAKR